jgi:hypothetical protein
MMVGAAPQPVTAHETTEPLLWPAVPWFVKYTVVLETTKPSGLICPLATPSVPPAPVFRMRNTVPPAGFVQ